MKFWLLSTCLYTLLCSIIATEAAATPQNDVTSPSLSKEAIEAASQFRNALLPGPVILDENQNKITQTPGVNEKVPSEKEHKDKVDPEKDEALHAVQDQVADIRNITTPQSPPDQVVDLTNGDTVGKSSPDVEIKDETVNRNTKVTVAVNEPKDSSEDVQDVPTLDTSQLLPKPPGKYGEGVSSSMRSDEVTPPNDLTKDKVLATNTVVEVVKNVPVDGEELAKVAISPKTRVITTQKSIEITEESKKTSFTGLLNIIDNNQKDADADDEDNSEVKQIVPENTDRTTSKPSHVNVSGMLNVPVTDVVSNNMNVNNEDEKVSEKQESTSDANNGLSQLTIGENGLIGGQPINTGTKDNDESKTDKIDNNDNSEKSEKIDSAVKPEKPLDVINGKDDNIHDDSNTDLVDTSPTLNPLNLINNNSNEKEDSDLVDNEKNGHESIKPTTKPSKLFDNNNEETDDDDDDDDDDEEEEEYTDYDSSEDYKWLDEEYDDTWGFDDDEDDESILDLDDIAEEEDDSDDNDEYDYDSYDYQLPEEKTNLVGDKDDVEEDKMKETNKAKDDDNNAVDADEEEEKEEDSDEKIEEIGKEWEEQEDDESDMTNIKNKIVSGRKKPFTRLRGNKTNYLEMESEVKKASSYSWVLFMTVICITLMFVAYLNRNKIQSYFQKSEPKRRRRGDEEKNLLDYEYE